MKSVVLVFSHTKKWLVGYFTNWLHTSSLPGSFFKSGFTLLAAFVGTRLSKKANDKIKKTGIANKIFKVVDSIDNVASTIEKKWAVYYFNAFSNNLSKYRGLWSESYFSSTDFIYNELPGDVVCKDANGYKKLNILHGEEYCKGLHGYNPKYKNTEIVYTLDDLNFRIHKRGSGVHKIGCFGCSNTFGQGLPDEETWPYLLQNLIGESICATYNYGVCGMSNDGICRLIYSYLQKEKPSAICCLFPDPFRKELFNFKNKKIVTILPTMLNTKELQTYTYFYNSITAFFDFIKNLKFIKTLCDLHNVSFVWHTWSMSILNINHNVLLHFIENTNDCITKNGVLLDIVKEYNLSDISNNARDFAHLGNQYNTVLAQEFTKILTQKCKFLPN